MKINSMNIGIFTNNYLPNPYGVTGSIESFRKEFEKPGHQVFIFAPKWKGYADQNKNVFRYPSVDIKIKFRFPLAVPYSRKMDKIISGLKLDIIHSQHPNLLGGEASKWARRKNIPLVFTWHTLYDRYTNFFPFLPKKMAANWIIKRAVKYANQADQIIVPTPSVMGIIKKWGVANQNIAAIPTGIEEEIYQNPDRNFIRKKYGIKEGEILLLLISRLTEEKNIGFLIEAVIEIMEHNQKIKFLLGGEGYLLPKIREIFKKKHLENRVAFSGLVERKEMKNYLAAGDIFVHASKSETQGMILSEAMYAGLPIVAIAAPGANSLVRNNATGFLAEENKEEFNKAVEKLIRDENLRKRFSEEAKKVARGNYTSQICAKKMLGVYEEVIQRKNN